MGRVTVKRENDTYCITHILAAPESCNQAETEKLLNDLSDIFLPVISNEEGSEVSLQCTAKGLIPLSEFLQVVIDKQSFIEIVVQMVMMLHIGEQNGFSVNNLDLDYDRVFIEPETLKLYIIYWPVMNIRTRCNLGLFFSEMAFKAVFNRNEDISYVSQYIRFFKKGEMFSLVNFEEVIMVLANDGEEREEENIPYQNNQLEYEGVSGETTTLDPVFWAQTMTKVKAEKAEGNRSMFGQKVKQAETNGTMSRHKIEQTVPNREMLRPNVEQYEPNETSVLTPDLLNFTSADRGGTRVRQEPPYLIREPRGERITIGKAVFVIGKDSTCADYVINNNKTISRKHASIIIKGSHYYVVDHNSTNCTHVDGKKIMGDTETEVLSGTKIRFSDEEFTFYS